MCSTQKHISADLPQHERPNSPASSHEPEQTSDSSAESDNEEERSARVAAIYQAVGKTLSSETTQLADSGWHLRDKASSYDKSDLPRIFHSFASVGLTGPHDRLTILHKEFKTLKEENQRLLCIHEKLILGHQWYRGQYESKQAYAAWLPSHRKWQVCYQTFTLQYQRWYDKHIGWHNSCTTWAKESKFANAGQTGHAPHMNSSAARASHPASHQSQQRLQQPTYAEQRAKYDSAWQKLKDAAKGTYTYTSDIWPCMPPALVDGYPSDSFNAKYLRRFLFPGSLAAYDPREELPPAPVRGASAQVKNTYAAEVAWARQRAKELEYQWETFRNKNARKVNLEFAKYHTDKIKTWSIQFTNPDDKKKAEDAAAKIGSLFSA